MNKLYLNYFKHTDEQRRYEMDFCVKHNINNILLDKIYILLESKDDYFDWLDTDKTEIVYVDHRPTYRDYFEFANKHNNGGDGDDDIHILCNLDIFFGEGLNLLYEKIQKNELIALTRWDVNTKTQNAKLFDCKGSQDSWFWKGEINLDKIKANYSLGIGGCDNAICGEFYVAGYRVINPAKIVKTYHLHEAPARAYNDKLKMDYYWLLATDNFEESKIKYFGRG